MIRTATSEDLNQIAICHREAFPNSVTSLFGTPFISQMLAWYLSAPNKFLFWIEEDGKCIGYCGGYIMDGSDGHGSATGMTQFGFNAAFKIMLRKPWLFFHPEIRGRYPFIMSNIKRKFRKIIGFSEHIPAPAFKPKERSDLTAGLVVIGVSPALHKKGIGTLLQREFEQRAKQSGATRMELSVRVENTGAISSYKRNGWTIKDDQGISYLMIKDI